MLKQFQTAMDSKYYTMFAMLILGSGFCSSLLGARVMQAWSFLPGGIIPFCFTFLLLDIATNQYGYDNVAKILKYYIICKAAMCFLIYWTMQMPIAPEFHDETSYQVVMNCLFRAFWASTAASIVAFYLNCYVFSRLYISCGGRYLWLRCIVSTTLGELVFSLISTPIFFYGRLRWYEMGDVIFHDYSFKIMFEIVTLPIIYIAIHILNKYEVSGFNQVAYANFDPIHKKVNPSI